MENRFKKNNLQNLNQFLLREIGRYIPLLEIYHFYFTSKKVRNSLSFFEEKNKLYIKILKILKAKIMINKIDDLRFYMENNCRVIRKEIKPEIHTLNSKHKKFITSVVRYYLENMKKPIFKKISLKNLNCSNKSEKYFSYFLKNNDFVVELNLKDNEFFTLSKTPYLKDLKYLKILKLSNNKIINENSLKLIETMICSFTVLQQLFLDHNNLDGRLNHLSLAFSTIDLRVLDLSFCNLKCDSILQLTNTLNVRKFEFSLNLSHNNVGIKGCKYLAKFLDQNNMIVNLNLENNSISTEGLNYIFTNIIGNLNLKNINLNQNFIDDDSINSLNTLFENLKSLKELQIGWNLSLSKESIKSLLNSYSLTNLKLESLSLMNCNFDISVMTQIIEFILNNSLKKLDISNNYLSFNGFDMLIMNLKNKKLNLKILNLSKNFLFNCTSSLLIQIFELEFLEELDLSNNSLDLIENPQIFYNRINSSCLKNLKLSSNNLSNEEYNYLCQSLDVNNSLEVLKLDDNRIGNINGTNRTIFEKNKKLIKLNLKSNLFNDLDIINLVTQLQNSDFSMMIKKINLENNPITSNGIQYILDYYNIYSGHSTELKYSRKFPVSF